MKRLCMIVASVGLLAVSAFAQVDPLDIAAGDDGLEQTQAQQVQRRVTDLYLSNFRNQVGLSEEQFLKVSPVLTQFVRNRFRTARERAALDQQLNRLLSQPNSSETDIQKLTEDRAKLETEAATMETRFVNRLRPDLTARQAALIFQFNTRFNERLRDVVDQVRANGAARGQRQQRLGPVDRPNANGAKDPARSNANGTQAPARPNANRAQQPVRPGNAVKNKTR